MGGQTPHLFISWCPCSDSVTELQGPGVLAYFASCAKRDPLVPQEERVGRESCCPGAGQLNRASVLISKGPVHWRSFQSLPHSRFQKPVVSGT